MAATPLRQPSQVMRARASLVAGSGACSRVRCSMRACLNQQMVKGAGGKAVLAQGDDKMGADPGFTAVDALVGNDDRTAGRQPLVDPRHGVGGNGKAVQ